MQQAQNVVQDLLNVGIDRSAINIIGGQHAESGGKFEDLRRDERAEGAATGAGAGAAVGGLAGFVAGLTALTIPGIGPVLALGPLGAALAGAGAGAVAGGGVGALVKMGVPEKDAHYYSEGIKRGGVLVTVNAPDDMVKQVANLMQKHGAIDIEQRAQTWKKEGWNGFGLQDRPVEQREGFLRRERDGVPFEQREGFLGEGDAVSGERRGGFMRDEDAIASGQREQLMASEDVPLDERERVLSPSEGRLTPPIEQRAQLVASEEVPFEERRDDVAMTQGRSAPVEQREGMTPQEREIFIAQREGRDTSAIGKGDTIRGEAIKPDRDTYMTTSPDAAGRRDQSELRQRETMTPQEREGYRTGSQEPISGLRSQTEGTADTASRGMLRESGSRVLPVIEEDVQVGKREIPSVVRVYSRVLEVPVEEEVRLREEHATIERRPVDRPLSASDGDAFKEASVEIRETREEPLVSKTARVKEEVIVGSEASERVETIHETARQTDVEVEKVDEPRRGMGATGLNAEDEEYRRHFMNTYGGKDFESYRAAYHYADEDSDARRFQDRDFSEIEEDIHRSWDRNHPGTWTQFKDAIRYGWNRKKHH
jgi:stress response protein YsnF